MELAKIVFSISLNRILRDKIKTNGFSLTVLEKWAFEIQSYVWNKIARTSPYTKEEITVQMVIQALLNEKERPTTLEIQTY